MSMAGIGLGVAALIVVLSVMNGFAKMLGEAGYDSLQVSWARAFGHIVFMLVAFVPRFTACIPATSPRAVTTKSVAGRSTAGRVVVR